MPLGGAWGGNEEWLLTGTGFLLGNDENVLKLESGNSYATSMNLLKTTELYTFKE